MSWMTASTSEAVIVGFEAEYGRMLAPQKDRLSNNIRQRLIAQDASTVKLLLSRLADTLGNPMLPFVRDTSGWLGTALDQELQRK